MEHEVLEVGAGRRWRPSRRTVLVLALVILLGAVGFYADHRTRVEETHRLDACRRELHDAAVSSDLQMMAVATTTHGPLGSGRGGGSAGLAGLMSRSATELLPAVVAADRSCRGVSVRPWHLSLKAQRDATTAYSGALAAKLRAVAEDGRTAYVEDRSLRRLRGAADLEEFGGHS